MCEKGSLCETSQHVKMGNIFANCQRCSSKISFGPCAIFDIILVMLLLFHGCHVRVYADDTILCFISDAVKFATDKQQLFFTVLQEALMKLVPVLNANKTNFVVISKDRNITHNDLPTINDYILH